MKKWRFFLLISLWGSLLGCTQQSNLTMTETTTKNPSILIVYVSRTQNTKAVADMIQQSVGGDKIALELVVPYPKDYERMVDQVHRENETQALPALKTKIENMDQYDTVFVGFPTWDMQLPPPLKRFFHQYDLAGKKVIPFNTHAGYGVGSGFDTVKSLCKDCDVRRGISIEGGKEKQGRLLVIQKDYAKQVRNDVNQWLQRLGFD